MSGLNCCSDEEPSEAAEARDNRSLVDTRENQKLSKDEIHTLRQQGVTGEVRPIPRPCYHMHLSHYITIHFCEVLKGHFSECPSVRA